MWKSFEKCWWNRSYIEQEHHLFHVSYRHGDAVRSVHFCQHGDLRNNSCVDASTACTSSFGGYKIRRYRSRNEGRKGEEKPLRVRCDGTDDQENGGDQLEIKSLPLGQWVSLDRCAVIYAATSCVFSVQPAAGDKFPQNQRRLLTEHQQIAEIFRVHHPSSIGSDFMQIISIDRQNMRVVQDNGQTKTTFV